MRHSGGLLEFFPPLRSLPNQLPSPKDFTTQIFLKCILLHFCSYCWPSFTWSSVPVSLISFHTLLATTQEQYFYLESPYTTTHVTMTWEHHIICNMLFLTPVSLLKLPFELRVFQLVPFLLLSLINHVSVVKTYHRCRFLNKVFLLISGWVKVPFNAHIIPTAYSI